MSFKEFDLSDYIAALEDFKTNSTDDVIKYWGNIKNFDMFIQKIKDDETEIAKLAIQQFGSIENNKHFGRNTGNGFLPKYAILRKIALLASIVPNSG